MDESGTTRKEKRIERGAKPFIIACHRGGGICRACYYETKISTIVKRAGVTQPTFYIYFPTKDSVFQELVEQFQAKLFNLTLRSRLEPDIDTDSLPDRIAAGLEALFHFFKEEPHLMRIGFLLAPEAEEIKRQLAAQVQGNLESEQQAGYFHRDMDMSTIAESLVGMIERLTITKLLPGLKTPEELAGEIVRLFLYGMLTADNS
ncbi:TetR/AcrR family transcriptional regulator [Paenibacillus sp. sgz302251]|uniref:TetR/AcrR family transcriptional regulator n=1 Tax=Paenibacillus sp. sgz302251 TaxID=3414493 RepID=UPI003C7BCEC7